MRNIKKLRLIEELDSRFNLRCTVAQIIMAPSFRMKDDDVSLHAHSKSRIQ